MRFPAGRADIEVLSSLSYGRLGGIRIHVVYFEYSLAGYLRGICDGCEWLDLSSSLLCARSLELGTGS